MSCSRRRVNSTLARSVLMFRKSTFLLIAMAAVLGGLFITPRFQVTPDAQTKTGGVDSELIQDLRHQNVEAFYTWHANSKGGRNLLCLVRSFDKDPHWNGRGMKLTIFDSAGKPIYEDYFESLMRIYETTALRDLSFQLVFEVVYGGTATYHLRMLDYRNGKIIKLLAGDAGMFNADAQVLPQFRSDIFPAKEPFPVMLTEGVGLASSAPKETRVYRYTNGAYRHVGTIPRQKLDDYMEDLLKRSRRR